MSKAVITITSPDSAGQMQTNVGYTSPSKNELGNQLLDYMGALSGGLRSASMDVQVNSGDAATSSGTLTLSAVVATDTCAINGVVFTAVAAGAVGNQFNVGGSDTITAANLAAAISASVSPLVSGFVTALSALAVVTVSSLNPGADGNLNTLLGNAHITASGARLTGGTNPTPRVTSFGA